MLFKLLKKIHNFVTAMMLTNMGFLVVMFLSLFFLNWEGAIFTISLAVYSFFSRSKDMEELLQLRALLQ